MGWNLHNYSEFEFWITLSQLLKLCNSEEWDVSLILIPYPYHLLTENIVRLFGFWYVFSLIFQASEVKSCKLNGCCAAPVNRTLLIIKLNYKLHPLRVFFYPVNFLFFETFPSTFILCSLWSFHPPPSSQFC